jgi:tRNA A37 threonylcarbamoyladenosine synthetase subunit TsaC/SUA5/YrdC
MKNYSKFDTILEKCIYILSDNGFISLNNNNKLYIACDAKNDKALSLLKNITGFGGLLVHSLAMLIKLVDNVPEYVYDIYEQNNGTLTFIFPEPKKFLNKKVLIKNGNLAITITSLSFFKELCSVYQKPLFYKLTDIKTLTQIEKDLLPIYRITKNIETSNHITFIKVISDEYFLAKALKI